MPRRLRLCEHDRVADHVHVADADHVDANYRSRDRSASAPRERCRLTRY
jgi:hypothetical protein